MNAKPFYALCGSLAIDTILLHKGAFHARILPESVSRLNVAFGVDESIEQPGGTAGNIAHNASLLGDRPLVRASVGSEDKAFWESAFQFRSLSPEGLSFVPGQASAKAWILTDMDNNQITGFAPGAMARSAPIPPRISEAAFAHISPDTAEAMMEAAKHCLDAGIPYYLDPGQALPSLLEGQGSEILPFAQAFSGSVGVFVNEYEAELLCEGFGASLPSIAAQVRFLVRTLGSQGAEILRDGQASFVPVCKADRIIDPTGCGDAFRAGFLHGVLAGWAPEACARLGSAMGSFAIESRGGQSHFPSKETIFARLEENYGPVA